VQHDSQRKGIVLTFPKLRRYNIQVRAGTTRHGDCQKGPVPLVVAVTGHRDLRPGDTEYLQKQVLAILQELTDKYPFTPIELLSGLAEGADRIVARVAVQSGVTLLACLPMDRALYEMDFETADSRCEFEDLLRRAREIITMPLASGSTAESVKQRGPRRNLQYQLLAEYLVQHSQILIALWDGMDTKLVGGTAAVVKAQLSGTSVCNELDFPETGPVYWIATPREKNSVPRDPRNPNRTIEPLERVSLFHFRFEHEHAAKTNYERIYTRMDQFNRDVLKERTKLDATRAKSMDWLLPPAMRIGVPRPLYSLIENYATADALAIHYQTLTRGAFWLLFFVFGLGALVCFEVFSHGSPNWRGASLFLYIGLIVTGYALYRRARSNELKTRYLDYRALAEGLRVQIFWHFAGLNGQVADHYLRKQKSDLDWIRNAIRAWSAAASRGLRSESNLAIVHKHWVQNQADYFTKRAKQNSAEAKCEDRITHGLLVLTFAAALLTWIANFTHHLSDPSHKAVAVTMAILPGIAGAIAGYGLKMAHREQGRRYESMREIFNRGAVCLDAALKESNEALAKQLIRDLGDEALAENGDWVLLHRERAIEVPWR
jgi:hypothetical protein